MTFQKVLVANRGEIAIRVFRALTELGKQTVAIYSHEDRVALHRYKADEAYQLGTPGEPMSGYLDQEAIIKLCKDKQVDAIHPGYGFLSENADFARKCEDAGIVFIGPTSKSLANLGDKTAAKALAIEAGVRTIPGSEGYVSTIDEAKKAANDTGYPLLIKAAFGGGGRGMRICQSANELEEAFQSATREAASAFGRGEVFIERFIKHARHIEVQLLGDSRGEVVHLFERDCSIQRRNQKVVEVAPALGLNDSFRTELYDAAVKIAKAAKLSNAATAEFLVECDENMQAEDFYFIEVNPRIQVEHTISELITGIDLVQSQVHIAEGDSLENLGLFPQYKISMQGAAIQARVTTEDPRNGFAPDTGRVLAYRSAAGFGIRLDPSIAGAGAEITPYYDSLLVKVCSYAQNHKDAISKLHRSLREFRIRGVATNIPFMENILKHPTFIQGHAHTKFVETTESLFEYPRKRNRATRILRAIADTTLNGPPGFEKPLIKPKVRTPLRVPSPTEPSAPAPFKRILDERGPEKLAEHVKSFPRLLLTDTTFRDAHQSLLATRVRTKDLVRIAPATEKRMDELFSLECWGGATFDVAYRFLREDPWQRLEALRKAMPNTLLQMLFRGSNAVGYTNYPKNIIRDFIGEASEKGVDVFRIFDCFNQLDQMQIAIDEVRANNKVAEVCICFTGDPDATGTHYNYDYYLRHAEAAQNAGAHMIAIKDMAGLLKANNAATLIQKLKSAIDLPIHVHTHDSAGTGVAMLRAAALAGADIVDVALSTMSGLTSQPSMNALVASLDGEAIRPAINLERVQPLADYWENLREHYSVFESGLKSSSTDVYRHEIPGGQYSNLKPQAMSVGLAEQWDDVRERYREVNIAFGDVTKVTPSSKVVGDMALWLVNNKMSMPDFLASTKHFDVPQSVENFMLGAIGFPEHGVPEATRKRILGQRDSTQTMHQSALASYDYNEAKHKIGRFPSVQSSHALELSYALYPNVLKDYLIHVRKYGDTSVLESWNFFYGLEVGEEIIVDIEEGKSLVICFLGFGRTNDRGQREARYNLNGQPRSVWVEDRQSELATSTSQFEMADESNENSIGAPMPGKVLKVLCAQGDEVEEGDVLVVLEAMKLETSVRAPQKGKIERCLVSEGDSLPVGALLMELSS